tara:strand:- start:133 stop:1857 length:1725 start_codon:yes stop_codon:yes gene_type:complete
MANGFRYESPINKLLTETVPRFVSEQMALARDERNRIRQEDRVDKKYREQRDTEETRYQENKAFREAQLNEERDKILIDRGSDISDLGDQSDYWNNILENGRMRTSFGQELLEQSIKGVDSKRSTANSLKRGLEVYNLDKFEKNNIESLYNSGNFKEGFNSLIKVIDRKVDLKLFPEINSQIKVLEQQILSTHKSLEDPYNILTAERRTALQNQLINLNQQRSQVLAPVGMMRMNAGGEIGDDNPDSTDWGYLQINDKVFDKTSIEKYGKPVSELSGFENIKLGAWISKKSPRKVGNTTSGWNNWTAFWDKDEKTGEELYKKHLNKPDKYYMAGGMSPSELKLIEKEFGNDYDPLTGLKNSDLAKAVMMAESSGDHSSINQNFGDGRAKGGKRSKSILPGKGVPFQAGSEWNTSAANYMASQLGISTSELNNKYGSFVQSNFLDKYSNIKNLSPERANSYLQKFTEELKDYSKVGADIKLTVPSGKHQGKKMNKAIVNDLLKQKRIDFAKTRGGAARGYEWLDSFANQLGFATAEELNSKEGAKAMKDYYSQGMQVSPQDSIDFSQPYNLNIVR